MRFGFLEWLVLLLVGLGVIFLLVYWLLRRRRSLRRLSDIELRRRYATGEVNGTAYERELARRRR